MSNLSFPQTLAFCQMKNFWLHLLTKILASSKVQDTKLLFRYLQ